MGFTKSMPESFGLIAAKSDFLSSGSVWWGGRGVILIDPSGVVTQLMDCCGLAGSLFAFLVEESGLQLIRRQAPNSKATNGMDRVITFAEGVELKLVAAFVLVGKRASTVTENRVFV